jgi:hypothetical protein
MNRGIPTWEEAIERLLKDEVGTRNDEVGAETFHSSISVQSS